MGMFGGGLRCFNGPISAEWVAIKMDLIFNILEFFFNPNRPTD